MKTILLVDDEPLMVDLLSLYLEPYRYNCITAKSGNEALHYLEIEKVDIVILDVMMPEMDGWTVCKKIRESSDIPIIMLSARGETIDVIKGLKNGADDYVSKPFSEPELLARIEALFRRTDNSKDEHIVFRGLKWNKESVELKYLDQAIPITPKEFALIGLFLKNPQKVFSRDHLLAIIWKAHKNVDDRTVDSHIRNLREKLRGAGFPVENHLFTVWGIGYKWIGDN